MKEKKKKTRKLKIGLESSVKQVIKDMKFLDDDKVNLIQDLIDVAEKKVFNYFIMRRKLMKQHFRREVKEFKVDPHSINKKHNRLQIK